MSTAEIVMTAAPPDGNPPPRCYLMCPPDYFTVQYAINPWMSTGVPVDPRRAATQWQSLRETYLALGHTVHTARPQPGLPDMVFAANCATVIGGQVLASKFRYPQRSGETAAYLDWFRGHGYADISAPAAVHEGEGDIVFAQRAIFAGHGFRSDAAVAVELADLFGLPVISLALVDPRFYHLDVALAVLDADTAAFYPAAFDAAGIAALAAHFPRLIEASQDDAEVLGLNAVSDGRHVVLPAAAAGLARQVAAAGFEPVGVDTSEFAKAGGGPKCLTLELR